MSNQGWTQSDSFDNWDDVSTEAPKPPEASIYLGVVVKAEAAPTAKGKPAAKLEVSITGHFQGDELPTPRKLFDTLTITKEAAFKVKQCAQAAGVEPPNSNAFDAVTEWCEGLVGQPVIVKTKTEFYTPQGTNEKREIARIDRYLTADQAEKVKNGDTSSGSAAEAPAANTRRRRGAAA